MAVLLVAYAWFWSGDYKYRGSPVYAEILERHGGAAARQTPPGARIAAVLDLQRVLAEYPSNEKAPEAAYLLGNLRLAAGQAASGLGNLPFAEVQYAHARAAYQVAVARARRGSPMATLAAAGIGHAWEAEDKFPEAARAFEATLTGLKPTSSHYEDLLSHLARTQERAGQTGAAIATYRRLLKDLPTSPNAPEVRTHLATLGAAP